MLNEGILTSDSGALVKSEMIKQLRKLGETSPERWEAATFKALTGATRDEIDWDVEDNQAGYFLWIKSFDALIEELIADGYAICDAVEESGERRIRPVEDAGAGGDWSQMVQPSRPE